MRSDIEPKFRKMLQTLLTKKYVKLQDRLYAIKTDPNWQWVEALYPTVFMRDKQIIFMSMDKFLSQNSTIVEPSCMLYNSDFIKDAVIFIDEFDATKATVLQNIIQNGLRDRIDYVELFQHIYSALQPMIAEVTEDCQAGTTWIIQQASKETAVAKFDLCYSCFNIY